MRFLRLSLDKGRRCAEGAVLLVASILFLGVSPAPAESAAKSGASSYDVYTRDEDNDGMLEILIMSQESSTGKKLVLMLGGEVRAPVVVDEYRRAIRIEPTSPSGQSIVPLHPSDADLEAGWSPGGLDVIYGDITGDHWQDMLLVGTGGGNSFTLSWDERRDQLVVQQVLQDASLKHYIAEGYGVALQDMNGDSLDDLVFRKGDSVVDVAFVTGSGMFFAENRSREASEITSSIMVDSLLAAADRGDVAEVMALAGADPSHHLQEIRSALGDEAFAEELARVEYAVPARVGTNFAQYELAVPTGNGRVAYFPLTLERSRNGLWKIEGL